MNEEIKEIEQYLKKCNNCFTCNNFLIEDKNGGHCMLQNAYNYITNLQEENQKLQIYKKFIEGVIITLDNWNNKGCKYKLHNMSKQYLYKRLFGLRNIIINEKVESEE